MNPLRWIRWCFASKLRMLILTVLVFSQLLVGSWMSYGYWSSPGFCRSCHVMEDYYESWERSPHSEVTCVECHFKPGIANELHGKWVAIKQLATVLTGHYSSIPYAEVEDASCLRAGCHDVAGLRDPVEFSRRKIPFSHEKHLGKMQRGILLSCTSCHRQRLVSTHMEVVKSTCFLCHFKPGDSTEGRGGCDTCHGPPGDTRSAGRFEIEHAGLVERSMRCTQCHFELRSGQGRVDEARCLSCHNRAEQLEHRGDHALLHMEHVSRHRVQCNQCHDLVEHEFRTRSPGQHAVDECQSCHEGPHSAQAFLYAGRGAKGIPETPNDMHTVGMDCVACHTGVDGRSGKAVCSSCHDDRYGQVATRMRERLDEMAASLGSRLLVVKARLSEITESGGLLPREDYRTATSTEFNLNFVNKAGGVHNPRYAIKILREGDRALSLLEERLGIAVQGRPVGFEGEECSVCHVEVGGKDFLHAPVALGLCTLCHGRTHSRDQSMPRADRESCIACHPEIEKLLADSKHIHEPVGRTCSLCHGTHSGAHRLRLRSEPVCLSCHEAPPRNAVYHGALATDEGCLNCHASHASDLPKLLKDRVTTLCLGCHQEPRERSDGSLVSAVGKRIVSDSFAHGPIREGDCTGCHDPHGSPNPGLLRQPYGIRLYEPYRRETYGLCFGCHDAGAFETERTGTLTGFRNGDLNLHFLHVNKDEKGRSCRLCHESHSSKLPKLMTDLVPFADYRLKIRFERRPSGGSCAPTCHDPRAYDAEKAVKNVPPRPHPDLRVPWPIQRKPDRL